MKQIQYQVLALGALILGVQVHCRAVASKSDDLGKELYEKALNNRPVWVLNLLEEGANPNWKGEHGRTALHWAAYYGWGEEMEDRKLTINRRRAILALVNKGADLAAKGGSEGYTAAETAHKRKQPKTERFLIRKMKQMGIRQQDEVEEGADVVVELDKKDLAPQDKSAQAKEVYRLARATGNVYGGYGSAKSGERNKHWKQLEKKVSDGMSLSEIYRDSKNRNWVHWFAYHNFGRESRWIKLFNTMIDKNPCVLWQFADIKTSKRTKFVPIYVAEYLHEKHPGRNYKNTMRQLCQAMKRHKGTCPERLADKLPKACRPYYE